MNIFKTLNSTEAESLTEANFSEKTNKDYPYYRPEISKKCPYFAICPECGNPIQIINLFTDVLEENITGRKGLHAKHYTQTVSELAIYDRKKFQECGLKAKVSLGYHQVRKDKAENERLRILIENNRRTIYNYIREITNIYFKNDVISGWVDNYLSKRYYEYKGTNERNLPYSILYTHHVINIFGQKIADNDLGEEICQAINQKSKFFKIKSPEERRIVEKETIYPYPQVKMLIYGHKIVEEEESLKIKIFEVRDDKQRVLLVKEVDLIDCPL